MANSLLGVLSALPEELVHLSDRSGLSAGAGDQTVIGGLPFWRGEIAGRAAVFVETGPGKVNGGVATALRQVTSEQPFARTLCISGPGIASFLKGWARVADEW